MKKVFCATKAVIVKNGKILIIKQKSGNKEFIDLPGGRMDFGLSPEENLLKEVKEEISIEVDINNIIGTWYFFNYDNDQVICITYLCKFKSGKIDITKNPDKEERISEYIWINPKKIFELKSDDFNGLENLRKLIKKYFKLD